MIPVLREGVCVVQMVLYKELRTLLSRKYPERNHLAIAMLTGAITNELFGSLNMEEQFQEFRLQHRADIEQELLCLAQELPALAAPLTDALRMQALCDTAQDTNREDTASKRLLTQAAEIGLLLSERELPLPASFMAMARSLGDSHRLITMPAEINPEDEQRPVQ